MVLSFAFFGKLLGVQDLVERPFLLISGNPSLELGVGDAAAFELTVLLGLAEFCLPLFDSSADRVESPALQGVGAGSPLVGQKVNDVGDRVGVEHPLLAEPGEGFEDAILYSQSQFVLVVVQECVASELLSKHSGAPQSNHLGHPDGADQVSGSADVHEDVTHPTGEFVRKARFPNRLEDGLASGNQSNEVSETVVVTELHEGQEHELGNLELAEHVLSQGQELSFGCLASDLPGAEIGDAVTIPADRLARH